MMSLVCDGHAAEDQSLQSEPRSEADEESEVVTLAGGGCPHLERAVADLVEDEQDGGARHVAVLG
jgi:hypothetical protein